ncbi:MAG: cysteine desulfurase [Chloroflexi bacterium]|nr:cysteine desulfurase [Chloroflexota bacterium]
MAIPTLAYHFALLREDIQAGAEKAAGPAAKRGRESVYLDYNATTPLDPRVVDAMVPFLYKSFGNPSSGHVYGQEARAAVDTARQQVSDLFGCSPDEVVFTSGGSESNNTAIKGLALSPGRVGHIITSAIEHPSVAKPIDHLRQWGFRVTAVPVDPAGRVNPTDIASAISPDTVLISIMHANNETGTIEPVEEIGMIARSRGIPFHTDAAQTAGKISIAASTLRADLITIAGHKLYAPKGVGALYVRSGLRLEPLIHGAGHEHERRAGTENVPGIVGLGKACEIARLQLKEDAGRVRALRDQLHHRLLQATDRIVLNGHPDLRLQNTLNVSFLGWNGSELLADLGDIAASTGSACHDRRLAISPVLLAMGATTEQGAGSIRFSLGRFSTQDDIDRVIERLTEALKRGPRPQAAC